MKHTSSASERFHQERLTRAVVAWWLFRHSLARTGWQQQARALRQHNQARKEDHYAVGLWLAQQREYPIIRRANSPLIYAVAAFVGSSAMLGTLSYSGQTPVNIWLVIGLFCLLPTCLSAISALTLMRAHTAATDQAHSLLLWWPQHLLRSPLPQLLSRNQDQGLLQPWLLWQLQAMAVVFQCSAIFSFCLLLLFRDIAFGWSSTIIEDSTWIHSLLHAAAAPWQWLTPGPSAELIAQSRFFHSDFGNGSGVDANLFTQWWPHLLLAMLFYGLLPRLLTWAYTHWHLKRRFASTLENSSELTRFIHAIYLVETSEVTTALPSSPVARAHTTALHALTWQCQTTHRPIEGHLGEHTWDEDERWLQAHAPQWQHPVAIVTHLTQTPTAELGDLLTLMQVFKHDAHIELHLLMPNRTPDQRQQSQLKSWQHFAEDHQRPLQLIHLDDAPRPPSRETP